MWPPMKAIHLTLAWCNPLHPQRQLQLTSVAALAMLLLLRLEVFLHQPPISRSRHHHPCLQLPTASPVLPLHQPPNSRLQHPRRCLQVPTVSPVPPRPSYQPCKTQPRAAPPRAQCKSPRPHHLPSQHPHPRSSPLGSSTCPRPRRSLQALHPSLWLPLQSSNPQ